MPYEVRLTPEAERQLRVADEWWRGHRRASPELLLAEFDRIRRLLEAEPGLGKPVDPRRYPDVRRVHAGRVQYHVYYRVRGSVIEVLAVWHARRGHGPSLAGGPFKGES